MGDSGWADLKVNDNSIDVAGYSDILLDGIYEELDYGSWAGEFFASGEAVYNKEEQAFIGIDDYTEDDNFSHPCDILLRVPDNLWYDSIEIRIESDGDQIHDESVSVRFVVKNGFISDEHSYFAGLLEKQVLGNIRDEVNNFTYAGGEFRDVWQTLTLNKQDGEQVSDHIQYKVDSILIGTVTSDEKSIYLQLIEQENEQD